MSSTKLGRPLAVGLVVLILAVLAVGGTFVRRAWTAETKASGVERGRYLVGILGCNDCHTPLRMGEKGPEPDMSRMLSGHPMDLEMPQAPALAMPWMYAGSATNTAYAGPWGVTYATNLTPDEMTGLGIWTEENFRNAMRTGRHWGQARPILPPMPWQAYSKMTDEDLSAVWAYLRTVPPVRNRVPDYAPPAEQD